MDDPYKKSTATKEEKKDSRNISIPIPHLKVAEQIPFCCQSRSVELGGDSRGSWSNINEIFSNVSKILFRNSFKVSEILLKNTWSLVLRCRRVLPRAHPALKISTLFLKISSHKYHQLLHIRWFREGRWFQIDFPNLVQMYLYMALYLRGFPYSISCRVPAVKIKETITEGL